jgi:photosystem II stability/assembly factor-like uncharacterized protein
VLHSLFTAPATGFSLVKSDSQLNKPEVCFFFPMRRILLCITVLVATTVATSEAQWQLQDAHTTADLRGIVNVGGGVAWASGTDGTILRTEDGGIVWQLCAKPPAGEHLDFRAIQAFDNNTAIIMSAGKGDQSRLYKTTDGCQSWTLLFTNPDKDGFFDALKFHGPQSGWLLGDPVDGRFVLMGTLDGGLHWTRSATNTLSAADQGGVFAASNSSMIVPGIPSFVTGGPNGAFFYQSDSVCTTVTAERNRNLCISDFTRFDSTRIPLSGDSASAGGFSVAQLYDNILVAVGGDYTKPLERKGTAVYFDDYFGNWFAAKTLPGGFRSAVAYDTVTKTWITVGPNGTDTSTDDGRNWRALKPNPRFHDAPDADQHWNALSLPYAVGPHGRIATLRPSALAAKPK